MCRRGYVPDDEDIYSCQLKHKRLAVDGKVEGQDIYLESTARS